MLECLFPRDVIDKQGTNCTSIVGPSDRPEVLLACCVPNLKFDTFTFDINCLCPKLYSYCYVMGISCLILYKLKNNA